MPVFEGAVGWSIHPESSQSVLDGDSLNEGKPGASTGVEAALSEMVSMKQAKPLSLSFGVLSLTPSQQSHALVVLAMGAVFERTEN